jgi:hypothetical protein
VPLKAAEKQLIEEQAAGGGGGSNTNTPNRAMEDVIKKKS